MNTHLTKKEVRQPDQFQQSLKDGFKWTTSHSKTVVGLIAAFLVIGGGISLKQSFDLKKETQIQEKYFSIEKQYTEIKRGFDEANREAKKTDKNGKKSESIAIEKKASGDLDKDYGQVITGFKTILDQAGTSKAAQMSALNLTEIYLKYGKQDEALAVISKANPQDIATHMLDTLLVNAKAGILADKNDCKAAIGLWEKTLASTSTQFVKDEVKLRMALCYENINDFNKAEQYYSELTQRSNKESDNIVSRNAEKYLRLLKIKKNTSGT